MCDQLAAARDQVHTETEARIAATEQLRHAERLTTVGRLAAGMAHELGTPMNVASVRRNSIIQEAPSEDAVASARIIKNQVDKMAVIIRQLLDFARRRTPRKSAPNSRGSRRSRLNCWTDWRRVNTWRLSSPLPRRTSGDGRCRPVAAGAVEPAGERRPGHAERRDDQGRYEPRKLPSSQRGGRCCRGGDYARIDVRDEGVGIRRTTCIISSILFLRPRAWAKGRAWACRSPMASSRITAAGSTSKAWWARGRVFRSLCRCLTSRRNGRRLLNRLPFRTRFPDHAATL